MDLQQIINRLIIIVLIWCMYASVWYVSAYLWCVCVHGVCTWCVCIDRVECINLYRGFKLKGLNIFSVL